MTENKTYWPENKVEPQTYEDILKEYRMYVNDPKAELPADIVEELKKFGKVKADVKQG
jgi:hypothetical protein